MMLPNSEERAIQIRVRKRNELENLHRRTIYANVPVIQIDRVGQLISETEPMNSSCLGIEDYGHTNVNIPPGYWQWETDDLFNSDPQCVRCSRPFSTEENIVSSKNELFHEHCFTCAQCFQILSSKEFYEFEGRRYCKYDFQTLFAPLCGRCGEFISSRVIKALNQSWHPECLLCDNCGSQLVVTGMQKFQGRPYCRTCFAARSPDPNEELVCKTCRSIIPANELIRHNGEPFHAHHFRCSQCDSELWVDTRVRGDELLCLRCFDRTGVSICAACRRPIEGRIAWALGRPWHVEHLVCHHCELPFMGGRFYEWQGHAYCLEHYQARMGNLCHVCNQAVTGVLVKFTNKAFCPEHFTCSICDKLLDEKSKLYEIDLKCACKPCYDRLPQQWKRRLAKLHQMETQK